MVFAAFSTQPTDAGQAALVNRIETSIKSGTPQVAETSIITAVECFGCVRAQQAPDAAEVAAA